MAFIIKKNKFSARIIRRTYVPKGVQDNTHSFFEDTTVGNIPLAATELPPGFPDLTEHELGRIESSVFEPARLRAEQQQRDEAEREADPGWRAMEALKWLGESADRSKERPVEGAVIQDLQAALQALNSKKVVPEAELQDPLEAVSAAAKAAVIAIKDGYYGANNASSSMKDSLAATRWAEVRAVVVDDENSVRAVLQAKGWVKSRGKG